MTWRHLILLLFLMLIKLTVVHGQFPGQETKKDTIRQDTSGINADSLIEDVKLEAYAFTLENIYDSLSFKDTTINGLPPYFNPLDTLPFAVVDKGYLGSAAMPLTGYMPVTGFNTGYRQYELYEKNMNTFKWYRCNIPFASLFFSPGADVQQFWTTALFTREFKDVSLEIDYSRMMNEGKYKYQGIKHTALNLGFRQTDLNRRFLTFFNFIVNVHQEQENGGITDTSYFSQSAYDIRINIPVKLNEALTRKDDYGMEFTGLYRLLAKGDISGYTPYVAFNLKTNRGFYKFYDIDVSGDSAYYKWLWVDPGGIRNYVKYNSSFASTYIFAGKKETGDFFKAGISAGIFNHDHDGVYDAHDYSTGIFGKVKKYFSNKKIALAFDGEKYFNDASGYRYKLKTHYKNAFFTLKAGFDAGSYLPPLKAEKIIISKTELQTFEFNNTNITAFEAAVKLPLPGITLQYKTETKKDYIYFNRDLKPVQYHDDLNITTIHIRESLTWHFLDFQADGYKYSVDNNSIMPLPEYVAKIRLAGIFKRLYGGHLILQTGLEYNYWSSFKPYGYNPAIGDFYVQEELTLPSYQRLDFFASGKIKSFLFFIRFNNILFPIDKNIQFKVKDYPQPDLFWRLGVKWTLLN